VILANFRVRHSSAGWNPVRDLARGTLPKKEQKKELDSSLRWNDEQKNQNNNPTDNRV
jgi:hypothetical protein